MENLAYNILWADEEIDELLNDVTLENLQQKKIHVVATAHDETELSKGLEKYHHLIDAVIVGENYHRVPDTSDSGRIAPSLTYALTLSKQYHEAIPFYLYTDRAEEILRDALKETPEVIEAFPRGIRRFRKGGECLKMFDTMIADLLRRRPTPFIVRNRYAVEMKAAEIIEGAQEYFMNFLIRDYENRLADMTEPFIGMRRIVEDILKKSVMLGLIPPIATDLNGTANYYLIRGEYDTNHKTSTDNKKGPIENTKYRMRLRWMHPTIANSLRYIVGVVQDGSHSNGELVLDVDRYFKEAQDVLLLRSVAYLLMDVVKCFAVTAVKNPNKEDNVQKFWYIAPPEVPVVNPFATGE